MTGGRRERLVGLACGVFAAAIFAGLWSFLSRTWPVSSESVSVYPARAGLVLAPVPSANPGSLSFETGCDDVNGVAIHSSSTRPLVSLCWNGRRLPILVASYASGIPYWLSEPFRRLHRDNVFRLRVSGLLLGLLALLVARRLVRIYAGPAHANAAVLCIACTPAFDLMHSTLIQYEILPWLAISGALDQLTRCRGLSPRRAHSGDAPVPTGHLLAASALLGLAMIANIKALFTIVPLGALAVRAGVRFRAVSYRQLAGCSAILLAVALPSILATTLYAEEDFAGQINMRIGILFEKFSPQRFVAETQNLLLFWSDIFSLATAKPGETAPAAQPGMLVALPALLYCTACAAAFLVRGRGEIVPAACGLLFFSSIALAAMFYGQYPAGNHTPIVAIFGIASGVSAVRAADWLASRSSIGVATCRTLIVSITAACLLWGAFVHGNPARFAISFNARALQELAMFLGSAPAPDTPLVVTTYNLAGVPEAITEGETRGIQAHRFLNCTGPRDPVDLECLKSRLELFVRAHPTAIRFLVPVKASRIDEAYAPFLVQALTSVARAEGRPMAVEASFRGLDTEPLLELIRIGSLGDVGSSFPVR